MSTTYDQPQPNESGELTIQSPELSRVLEAPFASRHNKRAAALLAGQALKKVDGSLEIDASRAKEIISALRMQDTEIPAPEMAVSTEQAQLAFSAARQILIDQEILSPSLASDLERILTEDQVIVVDRDTAQFFYPLETFPSEEGELGSITVSPKVIGFWQEEIRKGLETAELPYPEEKLQAVATTLVVGHELGHAVETVKKLQMVEIAKAEGENLMMASISTNRTFAQRMIEIEGASPIDELADPEAQPYEENHINGSVAERVAVGIHTVVLEEALKQVGFEEGQIDAVLQYFADQNKQKLDEAVGIVRLAKTKGIDLNELSSGVKRIARETGQKNYEGQFNINLHAYAAPFSKQTLQNIGTL